MAIILTKRNRSAWIGCAHFPSLELEIIVKTTRSSFESFWRVGRARSWQAPDLHGRFDLFAGRLADDVLLLLRTPSVRSCWRLLHSSMTRSHFGFARNRKV